MKKVMIGGFLALVSSIWALVIGAYIQLNLASSWHGNLFWSSALQLGVAIPLIVSLIMLFLGIAMMCIEYFRKEK